MSEDIVREAQERFRRVQEWESATRARMLDDVRFANGDSVNNYQWPSDIAHNRITSDKPCLTMNRVRQYCLNILNDNRNNKPSVKINPVGGGASFKSAQIFESIIRHIEYDSNAQQAYDSASWWQIYAGLGWFRVLCEYEGDSTFSQVIRIRRVSDALSVYMDPSIHEYDGSDAKWAFVFRDMERDEFEAEYPRYADRVTSNTAPLMTDDGNGWMTNDTIRVCEYFRKVEDTDVLHHMPDGSTLKEGDLPNADARKIVRQSSVRRRDIPNHKVEWFLIAGSEVVEKRDWPGKYIPLCRVVGEETVIDKQLDRKGHVRSLISSQQSYNYFSSAGIEFVALQSKTPYIAPISAIEGYESEWKNANTVSLSILPYNHMDDDGKEIPRPQREQAPVYADAYLKGMTIAQNEMAMVSGQFEASLGMQGNERSGKAINERQRAATTATYHYVDHLATAVRFCGKVLLDLIPRVYDVPRLIKILDVDGTQGTVALDPTHPQAHTELPAMPGEPESIDPQHIASIFNPQIGEYSVQADVGPAYQTRRLESFQALSDIMAQNESLAPMVMDLWAQSSDFPLADVLAERFRRMLPPQAAGDHPDPKMQQMQQMLAQQHQIMQQQGQELEAYKAKDKQKAQDAEREWYDSETKRLTAVAGIDPLALRPVVRELVSEVLGLQANHAIAMHVAEDARMHHAAGVQSPHAAPLPPPPAPPGAGNGAEDGDQAAPAPEQPPGPEQAMPLVPPGQAPTEAAPGPQGL